jgi:hypothetical protein
MNAKVLIDAYSLFFHGKNRNFYSKERMESHSLCALGLSTKVDEIKKTLIFSPEYMWIKKYHKNPTLQSTVETFL